MHDMFSQQQHGGPGGEDLYDDRPHGHMGGTAAPAGPGERYAMYAASPAGGAPEMYRQYQLGDAGLYGDSDGAGPGHGRDHYGAPPVPPAGDARDGDPPQRRSTLSSYRSDDSAGDAPRAPSSHRGAGDVRFEEPQHTPVSQQRSRGSLPPTPPGLADLTRQDASGVDDSGDYGGDYGAAYGGGYGEAYGAAAGGQPAAATPPSGGGRRGLRPVNRALQQADRQYNSPAQRGSADDDMQ